MNTSLYWWSPRRDPRSLASQLRHRKKLWVRISRFGGRPFTNFGDELSQEIVAHFLGQKPKWSPARTADLYAIGSIIDHALAVKATPYIWGTGLRGPIEEVPDASFVSKILAVRGPLTAKQLQLSNPVFGDIGLHTREVFPAAQRVPGYRILIPHYSAFGSTSDFQEVKAVAQRHNLRIVPPTYSPDKMAYEISKAQLVVSSSLHGVIVAHSYATPSVLFTQGGSSESAFKYEDHYAALLSEPRVASLSAILSAPHLTDYTEHAQEQVEQISPRVEELLTPLTAVFEKTFK